MKILNRIRASIAGRIKQALFRPYVIQRQFAGEKLQFYIGDLFGEGLYGLEHSDWPELDWIKAHGIREGDIVVDCGANHGFSSVLFAKWAGEKGVVHAFEPLGHNMEILERNLRLNKAFNVKCHCVAVGATHGTVEISTHPNATIVSKSFQPSRRVTVPLMRLDDILGDEHVGFLKIDVEGYELEVIKGARRILERGPRLDIELHVFCYQDKKGRIAEILALLPLQKYKVHVQTEVDGPIIAFDDLKHTVEALSQFSVVHIFCH